MSPPGSMLVANFMTDEGLKLLHVSPLTAKPGDTAAPATTNTPSSNQTAGSNGNSTPAAHPAAHDAGEPPTAAAGSSQKESTTSGAGVVGAAKPESSSTDGNGASTAATGRKPGGADDGIQKIGLLSHFKWGCPDNVEEVGAGSAALFYKQVVLLCQLCETLLIVLGSPAAFRGFPTWAARRH